MDRHLSQIQHLLSQYGDILAESDAGKILKTYRLVTQKETVLRNLYEDASRNQDCFTQDEVLLLKENTNNIETARVDFKKGLTNLLEGCRYGQCSVIQIEQFCMDTASPIFNNYPAGRYHAITEKLTLRNKLKLQNILYLGRPFPAALRNLSLANECSELFVFYYYKSLGAADPKILTQLLERFLALVEKATSVPDGPKFIFIDCDLAGQVGPEEGKTNKIVRYEDGEPEFDDSEDGGSEPAPLAKSTIKPKKETPAKKRGRVLLPCPAQTQPGRCRQGSHSWNCFECEQPLEYGFDVHFYCQCGQSPVESYTFCCGLKGHRKEYVPFPPKVLDKLLDRIEPFKEINILLLGETGVGKSTWVNGIASYMTYATLEDAMIEPVSLIPACFTMMDDQSTLHNVTMGNSEGETPNQSGTQVPQTYVFKKDDSIVRLIDTPGIGNPRGVDYDKKNIQCLMNYLANYESLHGICILLKPNQAVEFAVMIRFYIEELLTHFHRDACKNVVFVFTNARGTFYQPGDTYKVLHDIFATPSSSNNITLGLDTVYCVDNEAVRFTAALKNGISFSGTEKAKVRSSWEKSVAATDRLIQHIAKRTPHGLRQTFLLNEVRRQILAFTEPLSRIAQNIHIDIGTIEGKMEMLVQQHELREQLFGPEVELEHVRLPYRRTVCTAQQCTKMLGGKVTHPIWCHDRCSCNLGDIVIGKYPEPGLLKCAAMDSTTANCKLCGCSTFIHKSIDSEVREKTTQSVEPNVQSPTTRKEQPQGALKTALQNLKTQKDQLQQETEAINKLSAKFGCFLKANSIILHNRAAEEYLHCLMRIEEERVAAGSDRKTLQDFENVLQHYREEKKIFEEVTQTDFQPDLNVTLDIEAEKMSLYELPLTGKIISDLFEERHVPKVWQMPPSETIYNPQKPRSKPQQNSSQRGLKDFLEDYTAAAKRNPPVPVDLRNNQQEPTDLANTVSELHLEATIPYRSSYSDSFGSIGVPRHNMSLVLDLPSSSSGYPGVGHVQGHFSNGPPMCSNAVEPNYQGQRTKSAYNVYQSKLPHYDDGQTSLPSYDPPYDPLLMQRMPVPYRESVPQYGQAFYSRSQTDFSTYRPQMDRENAKRNIASPFIHGLGGDVPHLPLPSGNWIYPPETFTPTQYIYPTPSAPPQLDERSNVPMQTPNTRYESRVPVYGMRGGMDYSERNMPSHVRDWREGEQASSLRGGSTYEHDSNTTAPETARAVDTPALYDYDILPDASHSMQYGSQRMPHPANILQPGVFNRTALHSATALMAGGAAIVKMLRDRRGRTRGSPDRRAGQQ